MSLSHDDCVLSSIYVTYTVCVYVFSKCSGRGAERERSEKQVRKKVIIEGNCKIQYPAAVYSPLKQGGRFGSITLFLHRPFSPAAHHYRQEGKCTATGDIYYRPAWWLYLTQPNNSWFCLLAGRV